MGDGARSEARGYSRGGFCSGLHSRVIRIQGEDWRPEMVERESEARGGGDPAEDGGMEEFSGAR